MAEYCRTERDGHVLLITLDRPKVLNSLNAPACFELHGIFDDFEADPDLWVAIITGAGERAFCAGHDLADAPDAPMPPSGWAGLAERAARRKPLIAAVNGLAFGGGFEIVLACDMVTAGKGARFGLPEVRRGLAARGGGVFRLPRRLPHALAMELIVTGAPLDAARAEQFGLVNRLVDDGQALTAALELAAQIAANAPMSVRASKAVAIESADWPLAEGFQRQKEYLEPVFASQDAAEGVAAFRERRDPVWEDR